MFFLLPQISRFGDSVGQSVFGILQLAIGFLPSAMSAPEGAESTVRRLEGHLGETLAAIAAHEFTLSSVGLTRGVFA